MPWEIHIRRNISFSALEEEQAYLVASIRKDPNLRYLLVSEPTPTYTYGRSARSDGLLLSTSEVESRKVSIQKVSRGGQWTYHGPGQILLYPLTSLEALGYRKRAVCQFLCDFRKAIGRSLDEMSVPYQSKDKPFGMYVKDKKITSFGVAIQRGVILHGAAVYLSDQNAPFQAIHPCGVAGQAFTCLEDFAGALSWEKAATSLIGSVKNGFKS